MSDGLLELKLKIETDYITALVKYNHEAELLRIKREQFYKDNPDFWCKTMYMQVTAPPMKIIIND